MPAQQLLEPSTSQSERLEAFSRVTPSATMSRLAVRGARGNLDRHGEHFLTAYVAGV